MRKRPNAGAMGQDRPEQGDVEDRRWEFGRTSWRIVRIERSEWALAFGAQMGVLITLQFA